MLEQEGDGGQPLVVFHRVEALAYLAAVVLLQQFHFLWPVHEMACQPRDAFRVKSGARGVNGLVVQIRRENLHGKLLLQLVQPLLQEHRQ